MLSAKSSQELELRWESPPRSLWNSKLLGYTIGYRYNIYSSVGDPDPQDSHVFVPPGPGFGSISQRYGSESGSGSFPLSKKCDELSLHIRFEPTIAANPTPDPALTTTVTQQ
jgi:hypothetical protein